MIRSNTLSGLLRAALVVTLFAGISSRTLAQGSGRTFTATPGTSSTLNPTPPVNGTAYNVTAKTTVNVVPFLYITGSMDLTIDVNAWGSGTSDNYYTTLDVYHNMNVLVGASGFGKPVSPVLAGVSIPMKIRGSVDPSPATASGSGNWFDWTNASSPITAFPETTALSAGHFVVTLGRQISIDPTIGPTTQAYVNNGTISFTPSWP